MKKMLGFAELAVTWIDEQLSASFSDQASRSPERYGATRPSPLLRQTGRHLPKETPRFCEILLRPP